MTTSLAARLENLLAGLRVQRDKFFMDAEQDPNNKQWHLGRVIGIEDAMHALSLFSSEVSDKFQPVLVDLSNLPKRDPTRSFLD